MDLQTMNELFITSKMNSFFSFRKTEKRKTLVEEVIELKSYTIIRLHLTNEEVLKTKQEHTIFKEVIESLLFLYNHLSECLYPNIGFTPLVINGNKFPTCIIIFRGRQQGTSVPPSVGYQKITNIQLQIDEKWPYNAENTQNDTTQANNNERHLTRENKRIFQRIYAMLVNRNISVRKIFDIWIKQSQARAIYKKLEELWLFQVKAFNNNEKMYFPWNYGIFTEEHIKEILNQENQE